MKTIYRNGDIITMEAEEEQVEAVLVEDGRIKAVGRESELKKYCEADTYVRDLEGKTMMPSFIDAHGHIGMAAYYSAMADLSEAENFEDIVSILKDYKEEHKMGHGEYILGYGYDHNRLKEKRHPDKEVLDRVSTKNPVYIAHTSAHMGAANTLALEKAGITNKTEQPTGGIIGRIEGTNEPNGYVEESGMVKIRESQADIPIDLVKLAIQIQEMYLENGITTVQDGASNQDFVALFKGIALAGKLKIDVIAYPMISEGGREVMTANADCFKKYLCHFKIGGYKMVLDGSPQGKTAWMSEPYEGEKDGWHGYPWLLDAEVLKYAKQAVDENVQLLAHCNGDAACEQYLNCYELAVEESPNPKKKDQRPVMIHCQTVRDDQLDRMAKLQMIPSMFIAHTYYWGDVHLKNLGVERGSRITPAKSALERGLVLNFHQDTPVIKPRMLETIWCAVNRFTIEGTIIGKEQRISVYDAMKAVTINAAYQYYEENEKGSIKEGKKADFVILDQNPLKVNPEKIKDIKVLETIKEGITVYKRNK